MDNSYETTSFAKNLRYLRESSGRTQEQLAEILGVKRINITAWENAKTTPSKFGMVKMIADLFGVTCDSLLFQNLRLDSADIISESSADYYISKERITVYGKVCAGDGIEAFEDPIDEITNPYHRIKKELFALQVHGDSMNNVVNDGMYAIIEKKEIVNNGEIAVVLIDNEIGMLKRFVKVDESTILLKPDSSNPEHKSIIFEKDDINRLKILGRYIGHVSPMIDLI